MRKAFLVFVIIFTTSIIFTSCKSEKKEDKVEASSKEAKANLYQCPMKCEKEKKYKEEGKCPVCTMKLKKISEDESKEEDHEHDEEDHEDDND